MNAQHEFSSDAVSNTEPPVAGDYCIRIDDGTLVLPSGCTMPLKCVKTNRPVSERHMIFANLSWCPKSVGLWGLLGGAPLLFAYFVGREQCSITYGLERRIYYRDVLMTVAKILTSIALLAATIFLAISSSTHWIIGPLIAVLFVLFLISVVVIFIGNSPLRVVDYRDGMFWVKGFSQQYLDDLDL